MTNHIKVQANDQCPCWSGKKFKHCCRGVVDWNTIIRTGQNHYPYMSVRGRNILFANAITDALGLDPGEAVSLPTYKKAFTAAAVRKIYEAVIEIWPPDTPIQNVLAKAGADVSGLYIGDYAPGHLQRAVVRHSIYANKILLVDPFMHPHIVADKYNPILNPEPHRAQTLQWVNFYFSLMPWIDEGIVEFIRTPADFDRKLNWEATQRATDLKSIPEISKAAKADMGALKARYFGGRERAMLKAPDEYLRRRFRNENPDAGRDAEEEFIAAISELRDNNPDFLEPLGAGEEKAQLEMYFSGGTYEMAKLAAQISGSYLFTDLQTRWAIIEHDRKGLSAENRAWAPFAKAIQGAKLSYLNNLELTHALRLRQQNRLEGVRSTLTDVWRKVRSEVQPFDEQSAIDLANELTQRVDEAEAEWLDIKAEIGKYASGGGAAGLMSAGPLIATGYAWWLAGAAAVGAAGTAVWSGIKKASYLKRYPAAFFMGLRDEQ